MAVAMGRPAEPIDAKCQPLRGISLVVNGKQQTFDRSLLVRGASASTVSKFPRRPDRSILSESIPLYFIGRNKAGLWVAREAEGRAGGIFLLKRSALRFVATHGTLAGCATMLLSERIELDVENHGNPLVARLDAALRTVATLIPEYPPPMPIRRTIFRGERE
jgi:hypothetical protein